ncbi:MAG: nitrophenyl compound nitroreductase subunit ArsF family protein [Victivallales bacterium]
MDKWKPIIKNLLLAFVLVSVGYALGKNTSVQTGGSGGNVKPGKHLRVYYTHATVRCETCNNIEKKTRELLESKFKKEIADGRIEWQVVNFQENDAFARQFDVTTSGVIAVLMDGGRVLDYERLDGVWTLLGEPAAFNAYLEKAFQKLMASGGIK